ncbi:PaaI family thioesterase [candidate division CSSED10-310 bacterium]|uniref:PaaI family thioesterase n=1 Tax=candidate division CSSED10-310 bacterium TaxID=2855610 RepID=A0ABV6YVW7_UNCC1
MNTEKKYKQLPNLENHMCFGCSPINDAGLQMQFYTDEVSLFSDVVVPGHLCGWKNLVHGGVISTLLDEIMGRAAIYLLKRLHLTKSMTIDFMKPVYIGEKLLVEARIKEIKQEKRVEVIGWIRNEQHQVCASATGTFILFSIAAIRKLGIADEQSLEWFEQFMGTQEI